MMGGSPGPVPETMAVVAALESQVSDCNFSVPFPLKAVNLQACARRDLDG